jgi:7,8-dihydro-6-hydroxymethylpterin-pyrophosphokinase (HPPK)
MRLFRPARRFTSFGYVKIKSDINGRPKLCSQMAPSRNYTTGVERVKVTPWPQPASASSNSGANSSTSRVEIQTKRRAYIALGSNLGDRIGMIETACNEMSARGIEITRTSSLWETEPMYVLDQNNFVNGACEVGLISFLSCLYLSIFVVFFRATSG